MVLASFISMKAFEENSVALPITHSLLFQTLFRICNHAEFGAHCLSYQ